MTKNRINAPNIFKNAAIAGIIIASGHLAFSKHSVDDVALDLVDNLVLPAHPDLHQRRFLLAHMTSSFLKASEFVQCKDFVIVKKCKIQDGAHKLVGLYLSTIISVLREPAAEEEEGNGMEKRSLPVSPKLDIHI